MNKLTGILGLDRNRMHLTVSTARKEGSGGKW
jgi:hypothetical protein